MKKRIFFAVVAFLGLSALLAPMEAEAVPNTYVSVSTFTPGGANSKPWAFQNTSADLDVEVLKFEVSSISTGIYTGGLMQFWLFASTQVTHGGTGQVASYNFASANGTAPSHVSVSTGPINVLYENKQNRQLPLLRPLIINNDETATSNFQDGYTDLLADSSPLLLPRNSSRALVLEQRQLGTADITDGTVMVRVLFTVK
jgi:hypothetical protein